MLLVVLHSSMSIDLIANFKWRYYSEINVMAVDLRAYYWEPCPHLPNLSWPRCIVLILKFFLGIWMHWPSKTICNMEKRLNCAIIMRAHL